MNSAQSAAVELESCSKIFKRAGQKIYALNQVSIHIVQGRITGLLGPDGAGKTTLMRLAATLLHPDQGEVRVFGLNSRTEARQIQDLIGYMPQRFGLYEDLTVQENLDLYAALQGLDRQQQQARQQELLTLTALGPFGARRAGRLSGGMKQKLGLACALLRAPALLLLDEPTVGVDPISRRELWQIILALRDQGLSVLVSTAYLDEAERCDDIVLLHEGRLLAQAPHPVFTAPLQGCCFRVTHPTLSRRALQAQLRTRAGVLDATIQADGVRVVCLKPHPLGLPPEQWAVVPPRFEDAFVVRLHQAQTPAPIPSNPAPNILGAAPPPDSSSQSRPDPILTDPDHPPLDASATLRLDPGPALDGPHDTALSQPHPTPVIEVNTLVKRFGEFVAVKGISFSVSTGQIFGLLGANGAGKTTTFNMLCGLLSPTSGTLRVAGEQLGRAAAQARQQIGYVSQKFSLYGHLSVQQNLKFFSSIYGLRAQRQKTRIQWALKEFELTPYAQANSQDLPLGYKQRLALACALMHEPLILFLDEPTSGVDPLARREFWNRINQLADAGVTVMITTHFMEEAEYCDQLVLMSLGEILAHGTPQSVRALAVRPDQAQPSMEDAFITLIRQHESQLRRAS